MKTRGSGFLLLFLALLSSIASGFIARAKEIRADNAAPRLTVEELRTNLKQIQDRLRKEEADLLKAKEDWGKELLNLEKTRSDLAGDILEAQISANGIAEVKNEKQVQLHDLEERHTGLKKILGSIKAGALTLTEQSRLHLKEIPGTETLDKKLEALSFAGTSDTDKLPALPSNDLKLLMDSLSLIHEEACGISVKPALLWTATDHREPAKLLNVGHVAFAYKTDTDGRYGLALNSPADATGFRWTEKLPTGTKDALKDIFDQAVHQLPKRLFIPMDVTKKLRVEALTDPEDWKSLLKSGGLVMIPLGLVALLGLLLVLERSWVFLRQNTSDRSLREIIMLCREKKFNEAQKLCWTRKGVAARILNVCLERRGQGQAAMEDGIQEQLLYEVPRLQKRLGGVAILAAVAPLLGLLGTVTGIIQTFGVIKVFGNANPGLLAGGISEALITTAAGLIIAIPILLLHSMLQGRMDRILSDAEKHAATLLNILAHGEKHE